jgi:hypothetical protein
LLEAYNVLADESKDIKMFCEKERHTMNLEREVYFKKNEDDASKAAKQIADAADAAEILSLEAQVRQQELLELTETKCCSFKTHPGT